MAAFLGFFAATLGQYNLDRRADKRRRAEEKQTLAAVLHDELYLIGFYARMVVLDTQIERFGLLGPAVATNLILLRGVFEELDLYFSHELQRSPSNPMTVATDMIAALAIRSEFCLKSIEILNRSLAKLAGVQMPDAIFVGI